MRTQTALRDDAKHRPGNAAIAGGFAGQSGHWTGKAGQPEVTAAKDRTSISHDFYPITGNTQRVARMMPNVTAQNTAQSTSVRPNFSTFSRVRPAPPR